MKDESNTLLIAKFGGLLFFGMIVFGGAYLVAMAMLSPLQVIQKTLDPNNIIHSYEWFYDVNAQFDSRTGQIKTHRRLLSGADNPAEKARLTIELAAMEQSCRELANKYNNQALKMNKAIFKNGTPEKLNLSQCN